MKKGLKTNLFQSFEPVDMNQILGDDFLFDSFDGGFPLSKKKLFLRRFTSDDLYEIMKQVGLIAHLNKKGFDDIIVTSEVDDSQVHFLKVYYKEILPENYLIDLRLSETRFIPKKHFFKNTDDIVTYDMIVIEWLSAQSPLSKFNGEKPQLPGQRSPGLGVLNFCFKMMYVVAREVTKDGFLDIPEHMHGAIMYSRKFKFFDPKHEAILQAILRDLKNYSLSDISWGMITGTIIDDYKKVPQVYDPSEQVFMVSNRMKKYFNSRQYKKTYKKYFKLKSYTFNYDEMLKKKEDILQSKNIIEI